MHTALQSSIDKVGALSAFDDKEMTIRTQRLRKRQMSCAYLTARR